METGLLEVSDSIQGDRASRRKSFISTMPIKELIDYKLMCHLAREVSEGLVYRDFITVGL